MNIKPELLLDLLRLASERGIMLEEDLEVVRLSIASKKRTAIEIANDFAAKLTIRIRKSRNESMPPGGPPLRYGELWRWYVDNGGTEPLDGLQDYDRFIEEQG